MGLASRLHERELELLAGRQDVLKLQDEAYVRAHEWIRELVEALAHLTENATAFASSESTKVKTELGG